MTEFGFHPEDRARSLIDQRLMASGWLIQDKSELNLGAGLGVAVREFQTASGPVDYALFVGRRLCGVVEAKAEGVTLSGFAEQAARYIADMPGSLVHEEDAPPETARARTFWKSVGRTTTTMRMLVLPRLAGHLRHQRMSR